MAHMRFMAHTYYTCATRTRFMPHTCRDTHIRLEPHTCRADATHMQCDTHETYASHTHVARVPHHDIYATHIQRHTRDLSYTHIAHMARRCSATHMRMLPHSCRRTRRRRGPHTYRVWHICYLCVWYVCIRHTHGMRAHMSHTWSMSHVMYTRTPHIRQVTRVNTSCHTIVSPVCHIHDAELELI